MKKISVNKIKTAVKELCSKSANNLDKTTYNLILEAYKKETNKDSQVVLGQILKNASLANQAQRPLCQDTGQAVVFLEIGQDVHLIDGSLKDAINAGVSEAYKENCLRKSVVQTPLKRVNTKDNTPAVIHTEIVEGEQVKITIGLKGGGAENMSQIKMLSPANGKEGITDFICQIIKEAALKACPPVVVGVGIGGNLETSALNAKKALFVSKEEKTDFELELKEEINALNIGASGKGGNTTILDINIIEAPCHIASMPVAVNLNCHSSRHASATISDDIFYHFEDFQYAFEDIEEEAKQKEIQTSDIEVIRNLKTGEKILLSGTIYTARDEAHKRMLKEGAPFEIKDSIIFYAGPCPSKPKEAIGPIGPTTSIRMDKYIPELLEKGLLATIGKGERSKQTLKEIQKHNAVYFSATGGVATLLAKCVKNSEVIAYEELGPEAIYKLEVEKLPLYVACGKII